MGNAKKHKSPGTDNLTAMPMEIIEQRAQSDVAQGRYRRAQEWLKELAKRNRERYLPELIACYRELARQMPEKGQRAEAKTVFERIRELGGDA